MGPTYDDTNSIAGSCTDATKFKSIKALADYLKYLDANKGEYS